MRRGKLLRLRGAKKPVTRGNAIVQRRFRHVILAPPERHKLAQGASPGKAIPSIACKPALAGGIAPASSRPTRRPSESCVVRRGIPPIAEAHSTSVALLARLKSALIHRLRRHTSALRTSSVWMAYNPYVSDVAHNSFDSYKTDNSGSHVAAPRPYTCFAGWGKQRIVMPGFTLAKGIPQISTHEFGSGNRGLHFPGLAGGSWGAEHDEAHWFKKARQSQGAQMGDSRVKIRF